jgi:hypothetical protein
VADGPEDDRPRLSLEDVARAAAELAAQPELSGVLARFLELVRAWAAPSAVLAAVRERQPEGSWRLLPALSFGSAPLGVERSLQRIVEDTPECLVRATVVQPGEEIPGVKVRDNWVVPWWCESESGLLVLRGVPRPYPANLGDALALLAAPVWPRLLGGPAARVEALVAELQTLSARLGSEAARQLERLQAARSTGGAEPPADVAAEAGRPAEAARREQEVLKERLAALEKALKAAEAERDRARSEAEPLRTRLESLQAEKAAVADRFEERRRAAETAEANARTAAAALAAAQRELAEARELGERAEARALEMSQHWKVTEAERDRAREEAERLAARVVPTRSGEVSAEPAETRAPELAQRWEGTLKAFRIATAAARRASFVPAALRVSMEEAAALVEEGGERPARWMRVALLDRDAVGLESLAAELEAAGLDVRLANHPEELALLLKTPDGRELSTAICDVMAFRPDQNVAGLFRAWDKDRPGLAFYLSYDAENPAETERARRVPQSLTVGHLTRPLGRARLIEAMETLARRLRKA